MFSLNNMYICEWLHQTADAFTEGKISYEVKRDSSSASSKWDTVKHL